MLIETPMIKITEDVNLLAPFLMNLIDRIMYGNVLLFNQEGDSDLINVTNKDGYVPTRESVKLLFDAVMQWYDTMTDEDIKLFNTLIGFENLICTDPKLVTDKDQRPGYIYIIKADMGHYKVGRTKHLPTRMNLFAVKLPFNFETIFACPVIEMFEAEKILHDLWADCRVNGEWFDIPENNVKYFVEKFGEFNYFGKPANGE